MINAGAITTASLVAGGSRPEREARLLELFGAFAGHPLAVDREVYESERSTGHRNRAIGHLLRNFDVLTADPDDSLDLYFRQCSIAVDCRDLAVMAATLANQGVNPVTGEHALRAPIVPHVLSVMTTCGMYDSAGEWVFRVGMPAKSGVAGGVLAVLPGQLGIGVFSPRLDAQGNSVRGVRVCRDLAREVGLHFLDVARPARSTVRRHYDVATVSSKRQRSEAQRAWLDTAGQRARVYDLVGDLAFSGIEATVRRLVASAPDLDVAILDLSRVTRIDDVAARMLCELLVDLDAHGRRLAFVAAAEHPRFVRRLEEHVALAPRHVRLHLFPDRDHALEWCESRLLDDPRAPRDEHASTLAGHDLCRDFTTAEVQTLGTMVEARSFPAGVPVLRQGEAPDGLYFLLRGEVSVLIDVPPSRRKRLATLSAGMAFGELALLDRSPRSADVHADTAIECAFLPLARFDRMGATHPKITVKLVTNLFRAASRMVLRLNHELASMER